MSETDTETAGAVDGEVLAAVAAQIETADESEAAAIAVAIGAHIRDQEAAAAAAAREDGGPSRPPVRPGSATDGPTPHWFVACRLRILLWTDSR